LRAISVFLVSLGECLHGRLKDNHTCRNGQNGFKLVGHGTWDETARAVLALSKMNWNNDALYDPLPVTISYAKVLARVVKRMPGLGTSPYQFRFFM
jgi:hypothetical protein